MAPFGGYVMPIQYSSIISEHKSTRERAALFDTCHMGEFIFRGSTAVEDLEYILSCPVSSMKIGQCRYGFLCNETGGVIDDQILYRTGENEFFMVVNASTELTDFEWITSHLSSGTSAENISHKTAKIDLQGPGAPRICEQLAEEPLRGLKYYHFSYNRYRGEKLLVSRTGYTGEIGFEFYGAPECISRLWDDCIAAGAVPAGLGARDTLRLEMGFPLYGHELDTETNAAWSGFTRALGDKRFIGAEAIKNGAGTPLTLAAFLLEGRRTAHPGNMVTTLTGEQIGRVTSGSFAPSLERAIALGYIASDKAGPGTELLLQTDRGARAATVTTAPFYREATGRKKLENYL
jgi:aminomethyltransferase